MVTLRARFGAAVRRLRTAEQLSQEAFADRCHVHRTYMGAVERGEVNISLDNIQKIARALSIPVSALFAEAERSSKQSS